MVTTFTAELMVCVFLQVVSTVLLNIIPDGQQPLNLLSKAKISPQEWGRGKGRGQVPKDTIMTESEVCFHGYYISTDRLVWGRLCSEEDSCCVES